MTLEDLIRRHEGVRHDSYYDTTGHKTIGVGHCIDAWPLPDGWSEPLTDAQIQDLLDQDIARARADLVNGLPWFGTLDEIRQAALIDMSFNLGFLRLWGFHATLAAVGRADWQAAHDGMMNSLWARQVPTRAAEDAQIILTGLWPKEKETA